MFIFIKWNLTMGFLRDRKVQMLNLKYKFHKKDRDSLYLLHYQMRNWGDLINPIFSSYLTSKKIISIDIDAFNKYRNNYNEIVMYLGIGSILHHANKDTVIWGSGLQAPIQLREKPRDIFAVRGPMTYKTLIDMGISCPQIYGDPALLFPQIYQPKNKDKNYALGIVSHIHDIDSQYFKKYLSDRNVNFISMRSYGVKLIDKICECENIISTSLHGLVIADAYQIPACWIKVSDKIPGKDFKFFDYHASIKYEIEKPYLLKDSPSISEIIAQCIQRPVELDLDLLLQQCPYKNIA